MRTAGGLEQTVDGLRRDLVLALATTAVGFAVVLLARWGPDWPAQEFRALVASRDGLLAWTNQWYGGEALPGYSLLYPLFAVVLGAPGTGLFAIGLAAWCAGRLNPVGRGVARNVYAISVVFTLAASLLIGQVPFLLGAAFGSAAFVAHQAQRSWLVAALAALSSLASPLAGLFLLMIGISLATRRPREALPFAGASAGLVVAALTGGASGPFPCPWSSLVGVWVFSLAIALCTTKQDWLLRRFAALYALAAVFAFVVPNPIGGNITRLGRLIALPLLCILVATSHRMLRRRMAVLAAGGLVWTLVPLVSSIVHGAADPSRNRSYYSGLISFLSTQQPTAGRLEIPFTREHWEASYVAAVFPLARGWERQTDLAYNSVLYGPLTAATYKTWLDDAAVDLVALPSVPLDSGGRAEAALLVHPPSYLVPVWSDANWRVWRVTGATPIASGAGTVTDLDASSVSVRFAAAGSELIRIHSSRLWSVTSATGCIDTSPAGWLIVRSPGAGTVDIAARLGTGVLGGRPDCDGA
jgi:hypothetical protein